MYSNYWNSVSYNRNLTIMTFLSFSVYISYVEVIIINKLKLISDANVKNTRAIQSNIKLIFFQVIF